jgi:hypothetical protein
LLLLQVITKLPDASIPIEEYSWSLVVVVLTCVSVLTLAPVASKRCM